MKIEKVEGIVFQEKDYSESSKIINLITKEHGVIGVIAKGSRKPKSKFANVTSKFIYGQFHLYYKEDGLSTLIEVDVIDTLRNIRLDLMKISYLSFLCELVSQVLKQTNSEERKVVYSDFVKAFLKINEGFNEVVITNILELKILPYLGVNPILDECAICGTTKEIVTVNAEKYGFICKNCYKNEYIVNPNTIKILRMLYYVDIEKISKLDISQEVINEINQFIDQFYDKHTGLYLKSKEFLKKITK